MGMYRLEVSHVTDRDRQAILDLLMPDADENQVFAGKVSGIHTMCAFYEDQAIAYALAFQCEMTMNCQVKVAFHPTDRPMREQRQHASLPLTDDEHRHCAPLNGDRAFRLLR